MAESLKAMSNPGDTGYQIGAGLAAALGPAFISNMIDSFLTPSGIAALIAKDKRADSMTKPAISYLKIFKSIELDSPSSYRLVDVTEGTSATITFKD